MRLRKRSCPAVSLQSPEQQSTVHMAGIINTVRPLGSCNCVRTLLLGCLRMADPVLRLLAVPVEPPAQGGVRAWRGMHACTPMPSCGELRTRTRAVAAQSCPPNTSFLTENRCQWWPVERRGEPSVRHGPTFKAGPCCRMHADHAQVQAAPGMCYQTCRT